MQTIGQYIDALVPIDSCARGIAFQDYVSEKKITIVSAITDLTYCLERAPSDAEKRFLIRRYNHHARAFQSASGDQ